MKRQDGGLSSDMTPSLNGSLGPGAGGRLTCHMREACPKVRATLKGDGGLLHTAPGGELPACGPLWSPLAE